MPYSTPGVIHYTKNGETELDHLQPVVADKLVGIAIKQAAPDVTKGITALTKIAKKEEFAVLVKGVVQVDAVSEAVKGTPVYITTENKLTKTEGSNALFGRVVEVAGERGCPTGKQRVDLDAKDAL